MGRAAFWADRHYQTLSSHQPAGHFCGLSQLRKIDMAEMPNFFFVNIIENKKQWNFNFHCLCNLLFVFQHLRCTASQDKHFDLNWKSHLK
jgi:hypothetical protein